MTDAPRKRPSDIVMQAARTSSKMGRSMLQKSTSFRLSLKRTTSPGSSRSPRASLRRNSSWTKDKSCTFLSETIETKSLPQREPYLLETLGGMVVLTSIIHEFCRRIQKDSLFKPFFQDTGMDPHLFTAHQERFFAMAFTDVNLPQAELIILVAHKSLFAKGLCGDHFDMFVLHFSETLADRGFADAIIAHATGILGPLRGIFEEGARDYQRARAA